MVLDWYPSLCAARHLQGRRPIQHIGGSTDTKKSENACENVLKTGVRLGARACGLHHAALPRCNYHRRCGGRRAAYAGGERARLAIHCRSPTDTSDMILNELFSRNISHPIKCVHRPFMAAQVGGTSASPSSSRSATQSRRLRCSWYVIPLRMLCSAPVSRSLHGRSLALLRGRCALDLSSEADSCTPRSRARAASRCTAK